MTGAKPKTISSDKLRRSRDNGREAVETDIVRCPGCGNAIGEKHEGGGILISHLGRRYHVPSINIVRCEKCKCEFSPAEQKAIDHAA